MILGNGRSFLYFLTLNVVKVAFTQLSCCAPGLETVKPGYLFCGLGNLEDVLKLFSGDKFFIR